MVYNYLRDYDPQAGRYFESDLNGLAGGLNSYACVGGNPLAWIDPAGLNPLDPVERQIIGYASRGNWAEVEHTLRTLTNLSEREIADVMRKCASKRGGRLLKEMKDSGVGTGARSGQHGTPCSRAGSELRREANQVADPALQSALRSQADRLIQQGRGINH